jgi:hypothetical protein
VTGGGAAGVTGGGAAGAGGLNKGGSGGSGGSAGSGGSGGSGATAGTNQGGASPGLACEAPLASPSAGACVKPEQGTLVECNPITNASCKVDGGQVCDTHYDGDKLVGFMCLEQKSSSGLCAPCDPLGGSCGAGLTCIAGSCAKFCCEDTDCGAGNICEKSLAGMGAGVCAQPSVSSPSPPPW